MAKITDPDLLNDHGSTPTATEVFIDTAAKTIRLNVTGNLSGTGVQNENGVTLKALYGFLKEEWRNDPHTKNLAAFPFPMVPITDESFEFVEGWDFLNDATRYLIRDAGWTVKNVAGNTTQVWAGIIGLGTIESDDQLYFQQTSGGSATNTQLTGQVNQAVQVLRDDDGDGVYAEGSDFDRRTYFKLFCREQGQTYDTATLTDIGVATMSAQAYRFPIGTADDLKITHADVAIDSDANNVADVAPYNGMSITYYATAQARVIGGVSRNFGIIIDANGGTAEQVYEFVQWSLRRTTDINAGAGSLVGKIADDLLRFVGDTLYTMSAANPEGGGSGVYIDDFQAGDTNRLVFMDNTGTERTFPFVATLTLSFGANLQADASAYYRVFFQTLPGSNNDFGESGAVLVNDNDGVPMSGSVSGLGTIQRTFAYDSNVQGGRTAGTDAQVVVVVGGLATAQNTRAVGTIARSTTNVVSLSPSLERNYANP